MKFHYYVFAILFTSSLLLIGGGITGKVVSETCCSGDNCPADNLCEHTKPYYLESPTGSANKGISVFTASIGFLVLIGSVFMLNSHHKVKKKHK